MTASLLLFILSRSWLFTGAILLTGMTTTMVYPGVISLVRPVYPDDTDWDEVFFSQVGNYNFKAGKRSCHASIYKFR